MLTRYFFSSYEFDILEDKGNYGHWEFNAVIYETMSFIPLLTNVNYANFVLKPTKLAFLNGLVVSAFIFTFLFLLLTGLLI